MTVCIINQELHREKQYQIMRPANCGFSHVFPGKLFTLEQAKTICTENNFTVAKIGTVWECL